MLSRVVPDDRVEEEAMALARRIAEGAPLSARYHKMALQKLRGKLPVTREEERATSDFTRTEDFRNACKAFMAKQRPVFHGRQARRHPPIIIAWRVPTGFTHRGNDPAGGLPPTVMARRQSGPPEAFHRFR